MSSRIVELSKQLDERINNGEKLTKAGKELIESNIVQALKDYEKLEEKINFISNTTSSTDNSIAEHSKSLINNIETYQINKLQKFIDGVFEIEKLTSETEAKINEAFNSKDDNQLPPPPEYLYLDANEYTSGVADNGNNQLPPPPTQTHQVL